MAGMDENPYKAPAEHSDVSPGAPTAPLRRLPVLSLIVCFGMAAIFFLTVVGGSVVFAHRLNWRDAVGVLWGLVNTTTWCITAWATWTNRRRLRKFAIFADLVALLSFLPFAWL
jgi:hypothetical protein